MLEQYAADIVQSELCRVPVEYVVVNAVICKPSDSIAKSTQFMFIMCVVVPFLGYCKLLLVN